MNEITKYVPGTFCWEDLYTTDVPEAKTFYKNLFGWNAEEIHIKNEPTYSIFSIKGKEVCGVSELKEDLKQQKITPHWKTSISVENVDETIKIAKVAGGTLVAPPKEYMNAGRGALIQDPTGAVFSIWEAGKKIGALISDVPGSACWRELITSNVDVAGKFYATVFSWNLKPEKFGEMAYTTFKVGKKSVGGMMEMPKEGFPPYWLTYWDVKNCEKSLKKADSLGSKILKSTTTIKGVGHFAVLSDPQGAVFALLQPETK